MSVQPPALSDVLGPERAISAAEAAPLFGLRLTRAEVAQFDSASSALAVALRKARIAPAVAADLRLIGFPVFSRVRVTTKEEPATFRAIASRFPTWFPPDLLASETMKRDRAWNGMPCADSVMVLVVDPLAVGKTWAEGSRALAQRGKKLGLSLVPPPLAALSTGLIAMRELRGDIPASNLVGRTETWARSLGRDHRFTASWSTEVDGTTEIRVGTVLDGDRAPGVGTLASHVVPLADR